MAIRVLIADDQEIARAGRAEILDAQADIRMSHVDRIEPPGSSPPDVNDPLMVVVITTFNLDEYVCGALRVGAQGFLLKDAKPALLTRRSTRPHSGTLWPTRASLHGVRHVPEIDLRHSPGPVLSVGTRLAIEPMRARRNAARVVT